MRVLFIANPSNPGNASSDSGVVFAQTVGAALRSAGHEVFYAGYPIGTAKAQATIALPAPRN